MNEFIYWLNNNPWLNFLFLILAVLSIVTSIVLYTWTKRQRKPAFNCKNINLIQDSQAKLEGLQIRYNEQPIKNLTLAKYVIWNKGKETINSSDIAAVDPVRIEVDKEYAILQADVIFVKNPANNFRIRVSADRKTLFLDFDYFHYNEGLVFHLYHTGNSGEVLELCGTVKDAGKFQLMARPQVYYFTTFLDKTIMRMPIKKLRQHLIFFASIGIIFTILFFPILCVLMVIDMINQIIFPIPREYRLEDD